LLPSRQGGRKVGTSFSDGTIWCERSRKDNRYNIIAGFSICSDKDFIG